MNRSLAPHGANAHPNELAIAESILIPGLIGRTFFLGLQCCCYTRLFALAFNQITALLDSNRGTTAKVFVAMTRISPISDFAHFIVFALGFSM